MIPSNPILEAAFQSLCYEPGDVGLEQINIISEEFVRDGRQHGRRPGFNIWFRPESGVTFDALRTRVQKELSVLGLPSSVGLAELVMAMSLVRPKEMSALASCNRLLEAQAACRCLTIAVLRDVLPISAKFGDFTVGRLNYPMFATLCRRAGSDYAAKYERDLNNHSAITRERYDIKVLQVNFAPEHVNDGLRQNPALVAAWELLVERYYAAVGDAQFERFWYEYAETQELPTALGFEIFPAEIARHHYIMGSHSVMVLEKIGTTGSGWVSGTMQSPQLRLTRPQDVEAVTLLAKYGISLPMKWHASGNSFHPAIKAFAKFLVRGVEHWRADRVSEAFLHLMIALDLLFGEKGESTDSISRRASVSAVENVSELKAMEKAVKELYDVRSKYVHAGLEPALGSYERALELCRKTMHTLLRAQQTYSAGFSQWLAFLDMLSFAVSARAILPNDEAIVAAGLLWKSTS